MKNNKLPSIKAAYYLLVGLIVIIAVYSMITGEYQHEMSLAVEKVSPLPEGTTAEQMLIGFIVISLGYALIMLLIAGFLIFKVAKGKASHGLSFHKSLP